MQICVYLENSCYRDNNTFTNPFTRACNAYLSVIETDRCGSVYNLHLLSVSGFYTLYGGGSLCASRRVAIMKKTNYNLLFKYAQPAPVRQVHGKL